jgi:hypothetical protein
MFLVSGEGGFTLPNMVVWSNFFLGNCATGKVAKDGMAGRKEIVRGCYKK